jgi:hypothetical protein
LHGICCSRIYITERTPKKKKNQIIERRKAWVNKNLTEKAPWILLVWAAIEGSGALVPNFFYLWQLNFYYYVLCL